MEWNALVKVIAAVFRVQGVPVSVIQVKRGIIGNRHELDTMIDHCSSLFPGTNIVLVGTDAFGKKEYCGRRDIVRFLSNYSYKLPFKQYFFDK